MRFSGHIQLAPGLSFSAPLRLGEPSPFQFSPPLCLSAIVTGNARDLSRLEMARKHFAKRQPAIARLKKSISRQLAHAKHETLRNIEEYFHFRHAATSNAARSTNAGRGVGIDIAFHLQRFEQGFFIVIRNHSANVLHAAGNELYQEIGIDDPWQMPDPMALDFLARRQNLLKDIPNEIWNQIRSEIMAGLEAGDSIDEISARISETFGAIDSGRAETIASTETAAAYGFSRDAAMRIAGVRHKSWLTSHLPNVRPAHAAAEEHNGRVPMDEPFHVGGERLMYPGDPHGSPENVINCHCVSLALPPDRR